MTRSVFPDHCVLCGSDAAGYFCARCDRELPRLRTACRRCGVPAGAPPPPGVDCALCQLAPPPFRAARAALAYRFPIDAALKSLKFRRQLHYVPAFTRLLVPLLAQTFPETDALVPVPLHRWRHATRGFNQAHELARPLARRFGLPIVAAARRIRRTRPQSGLDAAERRRNMRNAFAVEGILRCRHPLVIDDVMTTGETCRQLAVTLLGAGAETVSVLTVARAAPPGPAAAVRC
jgi:ComF family protein